MSLRPQKRLKLSESFVLSSSELRVGVEINMSGHEATEHVHGHPALQHHFENMEQQREAGTLGMWIFLVTEIMFFGGMFLAYALYRKLYPAAFASGSNHLDIWV